MSGIRRFVMILPALMIALACAIAMLREGRFLTFATPQKRPRATETYLGFDRNQYPGDQNLAVLRKTFSYTSFWLNAPPGASENSWTGKRSLLQSLGFGFLVLFNGRLAADLQKSGNPPQLGNADASAAVASAKKEGFRAGTLIFLDVEEGGRMLPEQKSYIYAWVDAVTASGFHAGVYCSGIAVREDSGSTIVTADDLRKTAGSRDIVFWVANDQCPPSPGCSFPRRLPGPINSGISYARVWQYAQSPRRSFAASCPTNYNPDGNCYPPGASADSKLFLDLDAATESDPSHGRSPYDHAR